MKLICISDLHGNLPDLPSGDLIIIAGDICPDYDQFKWYNTQFRQWALRQNAPIIATWGNHDFLGERGMPGYIDNVTMLVDDMVVVQDRKIYGTPWSVQFGNWAFMRDERVLLEKYRNVPNGLDVLISHTPPYGFLDKNVDGEHCGSQSLAYYTGPTDPKLLVCGHIHEARGIDGSVVNASIVDEHYRHVHEPIVVEL
jgi:Icc-related predicted phosphoesterase